MNDNEFLELKLRASIAPHQAAWPDDKVHWQRLHEVADTARNAVATAWSRIDEIERDNDLSPEGKARRRAQVAADAIALLESDNALSRAQTSVKSVMEKWSGMVGAVVKKPADMHEVAVHDAIRRHVASLKGNKLGFIEKNASDPVVASALLTAPAFLSDLSETERAAVQAKAESHLDPKIIEARESTKKALDEVEAAWKTARAKIAESGGLEKDVSGNWTARSAA